MSQPGRQDARTAIFAALCQRFPNIPLSVVISIIFHDFSASDLYMLPLQSGDTGDRTTPFSLDLHEERCPEKRSAMAVMWAREPNLLFRHLFTYFSVLSAYFCSEPTIPLGFFRYLDHLQYLSGMHEWTPVHGYQVDFFNTRISEMRNGDFSQWAYPDISLMKKYILDHKPFLPEPNQYLTNKILYNGRLWQLVNDPSHGQISFIVRRTLDPHADEMEYVGQIKLTTNCLDMFNMPLGKPGEMFVPIKTIRVFQFYDVPTIREHLLYEGGELPFLDVIEVIDLHFALQKRKKIHETKLAAEKAQRCSQRVAHLKASLHQACRFVWLHTSRVRPKGGESHPRGDLQKRLE